MTSRWRSPWPILLALLLTGAVYGRGVGTMPVYIGGDEARFGAAAASIATSGRDPAGNRFPLFFHMTESVDGDAGTRWYQPALFYLIALAFRLGPVSEATLRMPSVVIGLLDVLLMYLVARRLFRDEMLALAAASMLALSPAHFLFSRLALDYICPLPFVLGWLWCVLAAIETSDVRLSFAAGLLLGIGFYSYIAAWIMMPLLVLLTCAAQRLTAAPWRASAAVLAGFAAPAVIVLPWLWSHPEMWRDMMSRYGVYDARRLTPLQGLKDYLNYNNVQERLSVYWDYFNPAYLFFSGGSSLTTATRRAGVFLLPLAAFLACGIRDLLLRRGGVALLLLGGFVLAPLPATFVDERYAVQRELFVLPFAVLIAGYGVALLLRSPRRTIRGAALALLVAMPVQYAIFYRDYFDGYRIRSAYWFDPGNFRGVAEYLISTDPSRAQPLIYLSDQIDDAAARWRFYLIKHGRDVLLQRTRLFSAGTFDVRQLPAGTVLVLYANDPAVPAMLASGGCAMETRITNVAGGDSAVILRKRG